MNLLGSGQKRQALQFATVLWAGLLFLLVAQTAVAQVTYSHVTLDDPVPQPFANFGKVAGVGDTNGDGVPDVLVGAESQDVGANANQGRAFVFSGADGSLLHTLDDPVPQLSALFGFSVAGVGDTNGDGVPDVLVGAPAQDVGANANQGQAFVFSGADGSLLHTLDDPVPQPTAVFGYSVAGVGDTNGDGVPDVVVGARAQNVGANTHQGQAFVFSGADGSLLHTLDDPVPQPTASFGESVAGVGDTNGDGVPDVVVGALGQDVGANTDQGQAFVFSGADGSLLRTLDNPVPQPDVYFGERVAGIGDTNDDGVPDVVVGVAEQGQAFVFSGADGSLLHTLDDPFPQPEARFGGSVAGVGDTNGDGVPDVLVGATVQDVGANINQGRAFVFVSEIQLADLLLSQGVDKTSVRQGELLTYTITVHNFGPHAAVNVVVNDTLPSGTTFFSAQANKGTFKAPPQGQNGVVTWALGNMANGSEEAAQIKVTVIVRGRTTITNTATVESITGDSNLANNVTSITISVASGGKKK